MPLHYCYLLIFSTLLLNCVEASENNSALIQHKHARSEFAEDSASSSDDECTLSKKQRIPLYDIEYHPATKVVQVIFNSTTVDDFPDWQRLHSEIILKQEKGLTQINFCDVTNISPQAFQQWVSFLDDQKNDVYGLKPVDKLYIHGGDLQKRNSAYLLSQLTRVFKPKNIELNSLDKTFFASSHTHCVADAPTIDALSLTNIDCGSENIFDEAFLKNHRPSHISIRDCIASNDINKFNEYLVEYIKKNKVPSLSLANQNLALKHFRKLQSLTSLAYVNSLDNTFFESFAVKGPVLLELRNLNLSSLVFDNIDENNFVASIQKMPNLETLRLGNVSSTSGVKALSNLFNDYKEDDADIFLEPQKKSTCYNKGMENLFIFASLSPVVKEWLLNSDEVETNEYLKKFRLSYTGALKRQDNYLALLAILARL